MTQYLKLNLVLVWKQTTLDKYIAKNQSISVEDMNAIYYRKTECFKDKRPNISSVNTERNH